MSTPDDAEKNKLRPKARFWESTDLIQYEGFWFFSSFMESVFNFRSNFVARDDDVILTSAMKTGTTWLKALSFCIMQRDMASSIELGNPHFHVPTIEATPYSFNADNPRIHKLLYDNPTPESPPRLLHTHLPYTVLPDSIRNSECKIVYLARNPKDTLISMWHFFNSIYGQSDIPLDKAFDWFCSGVAPYGPFFDHVGKYWEESKTRADKILFVKYEELKSEPKAQVSRIARFLGKPFANEEEVEEVVWKCSFERLKNLEVNKSGSYFFTAPNKAFFRKAEIGEWNNYLTKEMEEKIDHMSLVKFAPLGLSL